MAFNLVLILCFTLPFHSTVYSSSQTQHHLTSCLTHHNLTNFTLQTSHHHQRSPRNLRFHHHPNKPSNSPLAIISPTSHSHVSVAVRCCISTSVRILVCSGGHSYEGASSSSQTASPFAILDMSALNRVRVDLPSGTAWVEGGATLGETYHAIARSSPTHGFPAGSCPTVGISGLVLGGGFGFLSRKHGLAADNAVDAILINGFGQTLDRAAMGEDVFWALRGGGGGCWGVVTAWKIQLVRVPETVTAFIANRQGSRDTVAKWLHKWQLVGPSLNDEFYLSATLCAALNSSSDSSISFMGLFLGPKDKAMEIVISSFGELELGAEECREMSWIESVVYFSGHHRQSGVDDLTDRFGGSNKFHFKAKSDYVKDPISVDTLKEMISILEKEPKGYLILDPYGGAMDKISSNSIAFPHRKGNLFNIQYIVTWEEELDEGNNRYIDWIRGFYSFMEAYVSSNPRAAYVNYLDYDLGVNGEGMDENAIEKGRVWGEKYFLGNYDRLVRAKTRIDPHNVFRNQQSIPPLQGCFKFGTEGGFGWSNLRWNTSGCAVQLL